MRRNSRFRNPQRRSWQCIEGLERRNLLAADLNGDQLFDAQDIDALVNAIRAESTDDIFDINRDGAVTRADFEAYQKPGKANFIAGDLNLDRDVNFVDFLALSANFGKAGGWAEGDVTGDGNVGFADFLALSDNFGRSSTRSVTFTFVDAGLGGAELLIGATLEIRERNEPGSSNYFQEILLDGAETFSIDVPIIPLDVQAHQTDPTDRFCIYQFVETVGLEQDTVELRVFGVCA